MAAVDLPLTYHSRVSSFLSYAVRDTQVAIQKATGLLTPSSADGNGRRPHSVAVLMDWVHGTSAVHEPLDLKYNPSTNQNAVSQPFGSPYPRSSSQAQIRAGDDTVDYLDGYDR